MGLVIVTFVGWGGAGYSDICRVGWAGGMDGTTFLVHRFTPLYPVLNSLG